MMLLLANLATRSLAGARIGLGALATDRQPPTMTQAAVATQVHQALDAHVDFATQITLDRMARHGAAQRLDLLFRQ